MIRRSLGLLLILLIAGALLSLLLTDAHLTERKNGASSPVNGTAPQLTKPPRSANALRLDERKNVVPVLDDKVLIRLQPSEYQLDLSFKEWLSGINGVPWDLAWRSSETYDEARHKVAASFSAAMQTERYRALRAQEENLTREYPTATPDRKAVIMEDLIKSRAESLIIFEKHIDAPLPFRLSPLSPDELEIAARGRPEPTVLR
jgi:hypothetical protein